MGGEAPKTLDVAERTAQLAQQIAHHSHFYYNLAQPELSDAEFDRLWDALKQLDPDHPQLSRVGADIAPGSVKSTTSLRCVALTRPPPKKNLPIS